MRLPRQGEHARQTVDRRFGGFEMTVVPVVLLVTAAAALGGYNLLLWFRNTRKPVLIAVHLLLGLGGAETLVVFLHTSGLDDGSPLRRLALFAGGFLAASIFSGFIAPVVGRTRHVAANWLLAAHVASGLVGFLIVLAFAAQF